MIDKLLRFVIRDEVAGLRGMLRAVSGAATRDTLLLTCKDGTVNETALQRAVEHCKAAAGCLPLKTKADFLAAHAHTKAADKYFSAIDGDVDTLLAGNDGQDADVADALDDDREARQARAKGRAVAGVILAVGNPDAAQRLVTSKPRTPSR